MTRLFLDCGADVNAITDDSTSPLSIALDNGDIDMARLLIRRGAEVHLNYMRRGPLLLNAVSRGNVPAVRLLVDSGADVNAANEIGETPLHKAALKHNCVSARILV